MPETIRQSTIKSFLFCPRSYKYLQLDCMEPTFRNLAAIHGKVVHNLIHLLHTDDWNLDLDQMYQLIFNYEESHGDESHIPIFWKEDREKLLGKLQTEAVEMLENYRAKDYNRDAKVVLSEAEFTLKLARNGRLYSGTIDQLRKLPDGSFQLIDFKTTKFPPSDAFLQVDYQFGIYAYACWKGIFKLPDNSLKPLDIPAEKLSIVHYHLRDHLTYKRKNGNGEIGDEKGNPMRETSRSRRQLAEMRRDLKTVVKMMDNSHFPRNPSWATCPLCPYQQACADDYSGAALNRNQRKAVQEVINKQGVNAYG